VTGSDAGDGEDLAVRLRPGGARFWVTVAVLALLALAGVGALVGLVAAGPEPRVKWGYTAATLAFLLSTAQAAPVLALATRLASGFWGVPLRRAAELCAVAGLVSVPLLVVLLVQLPDWRGRPSIWFDWPGAPGLWDGAAAALFGLLGLALLYLSSLPDFAAVRDARADRLAGRLSLGWTGTARRWRILSSGVVLLGALYLMLFTIVHLLVVSDLAISLVPGWKSAVIPPYHAVSGLQGGVATTVLVLAALRRFGGLDRSIGQAPFKAAAKILLAFSLIWFWFIWSELLTYWYGRTPEERWLLGLLMFGPYLGPFLLAVALNFLLPFSLLIWNPIRAGVAGPCLAAALVLIGSFVDRVRLYVPAWSLAGPVHLPRSELPPLPPTVYPSLPDILIMLGMPAAAALLYLLALRLVPPVSLWEWNGARLLTVERPYVEAEVAVLAKPS
jgi:hypothetical protein